jgi:hypothetical protein
MLGGGCVCSGRIDLSKCLPLSIEYYFKQGASLGEESAAT